MKYTIILFCIFALILLGRFSQFLLQRADCYDRGGLPLSNGWGTICLSKDITK
jgi:hypothetical protein